MTNVFVLSTGRCGSLTFYKACQHATNYTAAHESRHAELGDSRLAFPDNHIESDNRLSWFLGRLERTFGDDAVYVHLTRDPQQVAESYNKRWTFYGSMSMAYARGILMSKLFGIEPCLDYVRTVTENIEVFLADKTCVHHIDIAAPEEPFRRFWRDIGAEGDLEAALGEFSHRYNNSAVAEAEPRPDFRSEEDKAIHEMQRVLRHFEEQNLEYRENNATLKRAGAKREAENAKREAENVKLKEKNESTSEELKRKRAELDKANEQLANAKSALKLSDMKAREMQDEVRAVRASLAFRIGSAVTTNLRSPKRWVRIPYAVPKAMLDYKRGRARTPHRTSSSPKEGTPGKVDDTRYKLESLGMWEPALREFEEICQGADGKWSRAHAGRELALHSMRKKTDASYRTALSYIEGARANAPREPELLANLATTEILCHYALGQVAEGRAAYDRAVRNGHANADVSLARVNFDETPDARVTAINRILSQFEITGLALRPNDGLPYDRLTSAVALPEVGEGPRVTVLIAAYEAQDTLATALRSLQEQTWKNLEIIVIDDCSPTSRTIDVAKRIAAADPRIQVIGMSENRGAYVARNRGLDEAAGEYVTLHDADDWSHPQKIETQVRFLEENPEVTGCTSQQARAEPELSFTRWTGRGRFIITNTSSFMFRRDPVREHLRYWDTVRFSADNELIRRIQEKWGKTAVRHLKTGPLSFQRNSQSSIVADDALGINGFLYGARKEYRDAQDYFHKTTTDLAYGADIAKRPFPVPSIMLPNRASLARKRHFPIVMGSDFRMRGGSVESCIQEIRAAKSAGYRLGLFEMYRYDLGLKTRRSMLPAVREEIDGDQVQVITFGEEVSCDLLVLRYPPILEHRQQYVPGIDAREIKVIVNQPPLSDYSEKGIRRYHLDHCTKNLRAYFGKDAVWYPNGPMVREALVTHHADELGHIDLSPVDWDNIIDLSEWQRPSNVRGPNNRLRIGRHSRDSYVKWPANAQEILAAYPDTDDLEVHVLGGAKAASALIGRQPANWVVHDFGAMSPREFLAGIDVFVFFAHPSWVESFPRTVLEAMAVGVPVILPESHRPLFGDRALYATPETAVGVARSLHANPAAYEAQVRKAWDYVSENYSYSMHARRLHDAGVRNAPNGEARAG